MKLTTAIAFPTTLSLILLISQVQSFVVGRPKSPFLAKPQLYAAEDHGSDEVEKERKEGPSSDLIRPLAGGPSLIFAMAQRLNLWDEIVNDSSEHLPYSSTNRASSSTTLSSSSSLPRFRQSSQQGISNVNPNFRTTPPLMNKKGYASSIIRNARKKKKPSLWRYSLRTYQKLKSIELMNHCNNNNNDTSTGLKDSMNDDIQTIASNSSNSYTQSGTSKSSLMIYRENEHFQGVLVAVAKLGLWQEALDIYNELQELVDMQKIKSNDGTTDGASPVKRRKELKINHSIVVSVIDACVRGMKLSHNREPLDRALEIILSVKERHNITPTHIHMNKLAAAYQYLGLHKESDFVMKKLIEIEQEFVDQESTVVDYINLNSTKRRKSSSPIQLTNFSVPSSKSSSLNEASFKILIQNSIREGDWAKSVQHLRRMTEEEGIYPRSRTLNAWSEAASKRERRPKKNKWSKKRERILVKGLELQKLNTKI